MNVKQKIDFFESLKARLSIDVYEPIRLIIVCIAPAILYGLFALFYWCFGWGKFSFLGIGIVSVFYIGLGIFWGCCDFYDVHVDILTARTHKNDECLSEKATRKIFFIHTFLLVIGTLTLLAAGVVLEVLALLFYFQRGASFIWVSICVCIAPAMVNISFFFIDTLRQWDKRKDSINNKYGADKTWRPIVCKYCKCMDCFSTEPDRITEETKNGSYTDVVDKTVGTLKYDGGSMDLVTSVVQNVGYTTHYKYRYYKCKNCGKENLRMDIEHL